MYFKKEYVVLLVIIVALSLYVFLRDPNKTHYQLPELPLVDQKAITKIELTTTDGSIVLEKKGDQWHIAPEGYLADDDSVRNMLDTIEDITVTALVSESKSYDRYDLSNDKKITVKAWEGKELKRSFDVGKAASSFRHTFVKLADDDRVYHARSNFKRKFEQTVDSLRDKTVLSFPKEDIQKIRITDAKADVVLKRISTVPEVPDKEESTADTSTAQKEETSWQSEDGRNADKAEIDNLIRTLSNLRCKTYIDNTKKEDLSNPILSLTLEGVEEYSLSIFEKKTKETQNYPAFSSGNDYTFFLEQWQADKIMKTPDKLFKEKATGQDKGQEDKNK